MCDRLNILKSFTHVEPVRVLRLQAMLIVKTKLKFLAPVFGFVFVLLGCSAVNTENPSEQNAASAANVIKFACGLKTFEVQIDSLTPEQKEEVEKLKVRCRIDNVAENLERNIGGALTDIRNDPTTKHEPRLILSGGKIEK